MKMMTIQYVGLMSSIPFFTLQAAPNLRSQASTVLAQQPASKSENIKFNVAIDGVWVWKAL